MDNKIIKLTYNGELGYGASIKDVLELVFKIKGITNEEFLDFKSPDGYLSNRDIIFNSYSEYEKIKYNLLDEFGNALENVDSKNLSLDFRCPYVVLYSDADYVTKDVILNNSELLFNDFSEIEESDGSQFIKNRFFFEKVNIIPKNEKVFPNRERKNTRKKYINPRVWVWCKSLNPEGEFNNNSIFDLSPFIKSANTSTSETGGQFSLNLINIEGMIQFNGAEAEGVWYPNMERYVRFRNNNKVNFFFKNILKSKYNLEDDELREIINEISESNKVTDNLGNIGNSTIYSGLNEQLDDIVISANTNKRRTVSSDFFFKNLISENDVIFISFRDNEQDIISKSEDFFISNDKLPGLDWDMIGLVDTNVESISYENTNSEVNVSGRDLMKLLIEDGSYFFANSFSDNSDESVFKDDRESNKGDGVNSQNNVTENGYGSANRLFMTGMIDLLYTSEARNIHFVMNLLISTLSNTQICNDRLFEYYKDSTKFQIPKYETKKTN